MLHCNSTSVSLLRPYDVPRLGKQTVDNISSPSDFQPHLEQKQRSRPVGYTHLSLFLTLVPRTQLCVRYKNVVKY